MDLDMSAAIGALAGITAAVVAIGTAKFIPAATAVAFKWAKATIFG